MASEPSEWEMRESWRIPLDRLHAVIEVVLAHLAEVEGDSVSLERDHFWTIPAEQIYDVYQEPDGLTVGQLSESWQHLEQMLDGRSDTLNYHLVWLADVLRAIGQEVAG
jgi:hypothetical protein